MAKTKIVLPADKFDALELAAMEYGGVGSGTWFAAKDLKAISWAPRDPNCPVCVNGLGIAAGMAHVSWTGEMSVPSAEYVGQETPTGISTGTNDEVVDRLIARGQYTVGADGIERVSWQDYIAEAGIVRGKA